MSEETPNLGLPYIMPSQAQKHVTHNEAIRALDALVQIAVMARDLTTPPAEPSDGERYIVGEEPSGAWQNRSGTIAAFQDGAWAFFTPRAGWLAYVVAEGAIVVHDGNEWQALPASAVPDGLQNIEGVGIATSYDAVNKLAVASAASLFSHVGEGHQIKINKSEPDDTASVLFQTNWSGRAEFGTAGDDNFRVKVSPDGTTWNEAIQVNRSSGAVGIGGVDPARMLHIRGNNASFRLDRDANTVALQMHRFPANDYSSPWKGYMFGVESHASGTGRFLIGDYGTHVVGPVSYRLIIENDGEITPGADNVQSLGVASRRWTQVYAASPTISTSDETEKQDIAELPDAWLDAWGDVEWSRFRYRDAVEQKADNARWHVGIVAQRVRDSFANHGLDAFELGLLCYDEWSDGPSETGGGRFGIRYEEALAMEAAWHRRELRRLKGYCVAALV